MLRKNVLIAIDSDQPKELIEQAVRGFDVQVNYCSLRDLPRALAEEEYNLIFIDTSEINFPEKLTHTLARVFSADEESDSPEDLLVDDQITVNLATYRVQVNGEPLNLTYLEYALLAFLMTHPNKTFSREALLTRVWGFDYLGGSRTVDVHVRRLRSKLGPEMSQKLETVRGFGYLWNAE